MFQERSASSQAPGGSARVHGYMQMAAPGHEDSETALEIMRSETWYHCST